ncbi:MAG: type II secretion system protein M [Polyangiaceae bacterium]|nr:type II secretion system protein M [Polyangiaceae bacterium]
MKWLDELSLRERRLVMGLGAVVVGLLFLLVPYGVSSMTRARRASNQELRDAISRVQSSKGTVQAKKQQREAIAARYAKKAPKLAGFIEQTAKEQKIEVPESQDKPEVPIGKRYVERATTVRLRRVAGLPLLKFLEKIEGSGYPVAITRLNLRRRSGDKDSYDVELGVSAYDRADTSGSAAPAASASAGGKP